MPLVSVVMPVYNCEEYIAAPIESILAQTFRDFELIVVDAGSQDRSPEIAQGYVKRGSRIRFIQLERNLGDATARNRSLVAAAGDYVTGMDSDDVCSPKRLQKQVDFLRLNPDIGGVGTHAAVVDADLQLLFDRKFPQHHDQLMLYQFMEGYPFVSASVMLRRGLALAADGYNEAMPFASDMDMIIRLFGRTRFANIPECLYYYRMHKQPSEQDRSERKRHSQLFRVRRLERLWGEALDSSLGRVDRLYRKEKLSWKERQAAKRDMRRLIEAMLAKSWIEPSDVPTMIADMNRRMEQASPRIWQRFCHWRRHHFGR